MIETPEQAPLNVEIVGGKLVISIGISTLAQVTERSIYNERYDEQTGEIMSPKVTDPELFAREMVIALEEESDDDGTRVHRMLEKVAAYAIGMGASGVIMPDD